MDVMVRRAAQPPPGVRTVWDLTDLLGRSLGQIAEASGHQFFIDPDQRGRELMPRLAPGPHPSLDAALTEIEKHTQGACRCAPEET